MATYTGKAISITQNGDTYICDPISKLVKSDVTALGIPELGNDGKILSSQLPSYVDDVEEYDAINFDSWIEWTAGDVYAVGDRVKVTDGNTVTGYVCIVGNSSETIKDDEWRLATKFPTTGEGGKIYIATDTNITYRWAVSVYVPIGSDLALGETEYTAYRGDRGAEAYAAAVSNVDSSPLYGSSNLVTSGGVYNALPTDMTGATSSEAGTAGLVPAPASGDNTRYLKGDGTWADAPAPVTMTGADGTNSGTAGYVPAPTATDNTKYLKGDGTWADVDALPAVTSSDNDKVLTVVSGAWAAANVPSELPAVTDSDDGKLLGVSSGAWAKVDAPSGLPTVTSSDNGKVLEVADGAWATGNEKIDKKYTMTDIWTTKIWSGLTNFYGSSIWTDGTNIYYSRGSDHYILDKSTSTWSTKTWNGWTSANGADVWTDGDNIYYSAGGTQHVLNISTSTWSAKTWIGLTSFYGGSVWTDGDNIYYSSSSNQYVLDKSTSTWSAKSWTGLTSFGGNYIWTDGENIYYSNGSNQYVLDKSTSTWSTKTWTGLTSFHGYHIWATEENIYCSSGETQYVLDKSTSTWSVKTWIGLTQFYASYIWTDGENYYFDNENSHYKLEKDGDKILFGQNGEFSPVNVSDVLPSVMTGADGINAGASGLVPAPAATDNTKYLKGNGTWADVPSPVTMIGADGTNAGTAGYAPAPAATDNTKYLKGDGTWADVDALPTVTTTDNGKVLKVASGDWSVENEQDISGLAPKADPVFTGSISLGRKANTTVGNASTAIGLNTTASASCAHAEGYYTQATATYSHAEGYYAQATATKSHAEGDHTQATGSASHAEGSYAIASGNNSHAEGLYTYTNRRSQHVFGEYNIQDSASGSTATRGDYVEIIGNGTADDARSNARTLDWDGNERLMGDIYVGCNADSTGGTKLTAPVAMTGADGTNSGTAGYVPAPTATDNTKYLKGDGTWADAPAPSVMTGATASAAGTSGLVPAPASGQNVYFLKGDGTWDVPPGAKLITRTLDTVTNVSGSYTHTTTINDVTSEMKAVMVELGDPSAFNSVINISTGDGTITLSCSDVSGTSTVKVSLMFLATSGSLTSSEFDVLAGRVGTLSNLHTTAKNSAVDAINETYDALSGITATTFYRQFWNSTNSVSIALSDNGKTYMIWTAGSSAGTSGAMMDSSYGSVINVSNGEYAILHKGSEITVSVANDALTVSSSSNVKMAIIEL